MSPDDPAPPADPLETLLLLLQMERRVRRLDALEALQLFTVNETRKLVSCRRVAWWRRGREGVSIQAISGVAEPDLDAPLLVWLGQAASQLLPLAPEPKVVHARELPPPLREGFKTWCGRELLWIPFLAPPGRAVAGLLLDRPEPWSERDRMLATHLAEACGQMLTLLMVNHPRESSWRFPWGTVGMLAFLALAGGVLSGVSVHQSTLAPATVAPHRPLVVASPLDGVIRHFHVTPNQRIRQGDPLFGMDETVLRNQLEVAEQAVKVAEAEHLKSAQTAFSDPGKKAELAWLEAQVAMKQAEADHLRTLLERTTVKAEAEGVVLFRDVNDWLGKPVRTGEKILTLADPDHVALEIQIPVGDAVTLEEGARVRFFSNVDPLAPLPARLDHAAHEARETPEGVLAYQAWALFEADAPPPRLGIKGTARILGQRTTLFFYLFRRPLTALRQFLGA